jgi:glyoxylase-like metal-dependent hydrolase (beta-lactamase superfamily II)
MVGHVPRIERFEVGELEIVRMVELEFPLARDLLSVGRDPETLAASAGWAKPHFVTSSGDVVFALSTLGLVSEGRRIVIDPCTSFDLRRGIPDIADKADAFLDGLLPEAGFPALAVDLVLNSHVDGVGWNVRPSGDGWQPAFPKARYVWSRSEIERVTSVDSPDKEALEPLLDAGLVDPVEAPFRVSSQISLRASPGHTPGNVDIWIESKGASAVLVGDHLLNPLQCADPDWTGLDMEPEAAPGIRRALLEECAKRDTLVIGPHFGAPGAGRVRADGDVWRLDPVASQGGA